MEKEKWHMNKRGREGDRSVSPTDRSIAKKTRTKDFATGQGLQRGESSTAQQDTQDDAAMELFLDKKTLGDKISGSAIYSAKNTHEWSRGTVREIYKHLYDRLQILRNYSQYDNTTIEEAIKAYKEIKEEYVNGIYNNIKRDTAKKRCRNLGFPFAQD
jgi:hypothetical protein